MPDNRRSTVLRYVQAAAWLLIGAQLLVVGAAICGQWYRRFQFRRAMVRIQAATQRLDSRDRRMPNSGLRVGLQVGAVPVRTSTGALIDLKAGIRERRAVLFVSSCAPCVADLLSEYTRMWQQGLDVKVIARAAPEAIATARREYGWRLPIYSDYGLPQASRACRVSYRPTVLVLDRNGEVIYAQGTNEDRAVAWARVERDLEGGSREQ